MTKTATTSVDIHPLIAKRWSPRSFDAKASITDQEVLALLEAARWAPSSNNTQPWRFAVVRREDELFASVTEALVGFNKSWAPRASAFIVVGVESVDAEGRERKWSDYDTGIASALLTTQAQELDLHVHQMGGFNPDSLHATLGFNERTKLITVIAVGRIGSTDQLSEELRQRETAPRQRLELSELVVHGLPTSVKDHS